MGWGDALMAAGSAQTLYDAHPGDGPVAICDLHGNALSHELWDGNAVVAKPDGRFENKRRPGAPYIKNAKGCRPYIQYPFTDQTGWVWATEWKARDHRGRLFLTGEELELGVHARAVHGQYLLIEPTPIRGNKNRRWPDEQWQALSKRLEAFGLPILQLYHPAARMLPNTIPVPHQGFRQACGVLASAAIFVATEGGLVHAAAALGIPTVALWGGCVSAEVLGYPEHVNLVDDSPETPCGKWAPCPHCIAAWAKLTPERVYLAVQQTGAAHGLP